MVLQGIMLLRCLIIFDEVFFDEERVDSDGLFSFLKNHFHINLI